MVGWNAFVQDEIMLWDIAGGSALVQFAGGIVNIKDVEGIPFTKRIRRAHVERNYYYHDC